MNKSLVEVKYFNEGIDHSFDHAVEFSMSHFGLKHTSSDFNNESNQRSLGFEKGITSFTWLHADISDKKLYRLNGLDIKEIYDINPIIIGCIYGVFYVIDMIDNPEEYFKDKEPKSLCEGSLTGRVIGLNVMTFDKINEMFRPIAVHGCKDRNMISGGCIMLSNQDVYEVYDCVDITTPVVIAMSKPFQFIVPDELITWCKNNGSRAISKLNKLARDSQPELQLAGG